ncbi:hypothetical protein [Burkholderia sp. WAC0059]|uniref:hypothetical protein n=1 Tax=Burkholderia sp. WAC0059 TaxID=2066022 RepID=UPI0011AEEC39|nr:hypothetical protein [Burkholderia sp. WAC0059]
MLRHSSSRAEVSRIVNERSAAGQPWAGNTVIKRAKKKRRQRRFFWIHASGVGRRQPPDDRADA